MSITVKYFEPAWGPVHYKAVRDFEKHPEVIKTKTVDDIISIFFK